MPAMRASRDLFLLELAAVAGPRALLGAMALHAAVMAAFLAAWGGGVPRLPGANVFEQFVLVQWVLLVVLLPWTAARCLPRECGDDVRARAVVSGVRPAHVVLVRATAGLAGLAVVIAGALPFALAAQQMAGVPLGQVMRAAMAALGPAALAVVAALKARLDGRDDVAVWLTATAIVAGASIGASLLPGVSAPWLSWAVAAGLAVTLRQADAAVDDLAEDAS